MAANNHLAVLASLGRDLEKKSLFCMRFSAVLDRLRRNLEVVDGESDLLTDLQKRRDEALNVLDSLANQRVREAAGNLARLRSLLSGAVWQSAEQIVPGLEERANSQDNQLREWRRQAKDL